MININVFRHDLIHHAAQLDLLQKQAAQYERDIAALLSSQELYQKVIILLQKTSEYSRSRMKNRIEGIVTQALQVCFGNEYSFVIEMDTRGGAPVANLCVEQAGNKFNPIDSKGGGLVDIVTTALRLAVLELYEPKIDGPIFLDEVGKHVSSEYIEAFAYFLKEYSARVGRQIILVTHNETLSGIGDKTFRVIIENGVSKVREI